MRARAVRVKRRAAMDSLGTSRSLELVSTCEQNQFDMYVPRVVGNSSNNDNGLALVGVLCGWINGLCHYPRDRHWWSCVSFISAHPELILGGLAYG